MSDILNLLQNACRNWEDMGTFGKLDLEIFLSISAQTTIYALYVLWNLLRRKYEVPVQGLYSPYCFHHYTVQRGSTVIRTVWLQRVTENKEDLQRCWFWSQYSLIAGFGLLGNSKPCNVAFFSMVEYRCVLQTRAVTSSWAYAECHGMNQLKLPCEPFPVEKYQCIFPPTIAFQTLVL